MVLVRVLSDRAPHSKRRSARRVSRSLFHQPHTPRSLRHMTAIAPGSSCPLQPITVSSSRSRQAGGRKGIGLGCHVSGLSSSLISSPHPDVGFSFSPSSSSSFNIKLFLLFGFSGIIKRLSTEFRINLLSHDCDERLAPQVCRHRFARLADGTCSPSLFGLGYQVISHRVTSLPWFAYLNLKLSTHRNIVLTIALLHTFVLVTMLCAVIAFHRISISAR